MTKIEKYDLCTQAENLRKNIEISFLSLGEKIKLIKEKNLWEGKYENYADFIENGLKMNQGTASKLVKIYETFIEKYSFSGEKLSGTSWTNLYIVIPLIKNKEDAEVWIEKASLLTRTDLSREIEEKKTGIVIKECEHEWIHISMRKCEKCHVKELNLNN